MYTITNSIKKIWFHRVTFNPIKVTDEETIA